ncbi:hypothetical protein AVEN_130577-1 [Araneus ventricosus]|uniref:Uncharacterized protein n=1 Tax=Araneus ventricosus TaxID=182803 RepID=A0A4Y2HIV9_ARAVE|nr:hypothetical protein AVEN_130577-1 [Araneus ventricosus]
MSLQCKLAASSSYGDFEACVNLLQACFTLVVTNLQKACKFAVQVCCKLKLLSGLAIAARTCVDVPSSVAVFALLDLLVSARESVVLNSMISFATPSQQNNVNRFFLRKWHFFSQLVHLPQNENEISHRFHHLYRDL